jgi:serine/threonine protein kinase
MSEIHDKYMSLGGESGWIGRPFHGERSTPDGRGRFQTFACRKNGWPVSIHWTKETGAHVTYGAIRSNWEQQGWENGPLGYPTSDEADYDENGVKGRISHFQGGALVWNERTGEVTKQDIIDGYRLIRSLGSGGFGEVWLCQAQTMGDYRALKRIPRTGVAQLQKEKEALQLYRRKADALHSPHLILIEHVNSNEIELYYIMRLADGLTDVKPTDPSWQPKTLSTLIQTHASLPKWLSSAEICRIFRPILQALQMLSNVGLVHRDVKPDNILFINGSPCLGDIGLLRANELKMTRLGTPLFEPPTWYEGGNPDMWGAAATLYTLLTGNSPDRMGRSAFRWPPQGEASLSIAERAKWKRLHKVIGRAIEEIVADRYPDFQSMEEALPLPHPRRSR